MRTIKLLGLTTLSLSLAVAHVSAFSLIGPFAPWMDEVESYHDGAIGGPMNLGNEYRWTVPVVTYAYDQSFISYFGFNGVVAVDSAIKTLNDLPPASSLNPSNYPFSTLSENFAAEDASLIDLKSTALSCLLEQMGLASPERYAFCLRNYSEANNTTNYNVITRNFDPVTYAYSSNLNNVEYSYYFVQSAIPHRADVIEFASDPLAEGFTSVAGFNSALSGRYFTGLTFDDVGGLKYLLGTNNVNMESLLPNVRGSGANVSNYVNTAMRPGIDKITFQKVSIDPISGQLSRPITNIFTDTFLSNGILSQQTLERVITKPDIIFTANDAGGAYIWRTGTTNWVNNGGLGQDGPGIIQPPILITFNTTGSRLSNTGIYPAPYAPEQSTWGTFDGSANAPIVYPAGSWTPPGSATTFNFRLMNLTKTPIANSDFSWTVSAQPNAHILLQTSTNLVDWTTVTTVVNRGGTFTYTDTIPANTPQRYFRTSPE